MTNTVLWGMMITGWAVHVWGQEAQKLSELSAQFGHEPKEALKINK